MNGSSFLNALSRLPAGTRLNNQVPPAASTLPLGQVPGLTSIGTMPIPGAPVYGGELEAPNVAAPKRPGDPLAPGLRDRFMAALGQSIGRIAQGQGRDRWFRPFAD